MSGVAPSAEILQTSIFNSSFEEDRWEEYSQNRVYSPLPQTEFPPSRQRPVAKKSFEGPVPCYKRYSTWIFTALSVVGAVTVLFGIAALFAANGQTLPNAFSFLQGIGTIGHAGATGIIVGGALMSFAGIVGIFRSYFNARRDKMEHLNY